MLGNKQLLLRLTAARTALQIVLPRSTAQMAMHNKLLNQRWQLAHNRPIITYGICNYLLIASALRIRPDDMHRFCYFFNGNVYGLLQISAFGRIASTSPS